MWRSHIVGPLLLSLLTAAPAPGVQRNPGQVELEIRVVDQDTNRPIPVRMHLKDARGRPVIPPDVVSWDDHFIVPGVAVLQLRAGEYTFEMERGPEYRLRTGHFSAKRGDSDNVQLEMQRFAHLKKEGWWSGDLHIQRCPEDMPLVMQAEDLHVAPVITWDHQQNRWQDQPLPDNPLVRVDRDRFFHQLAGSDARAGGNLLYLNLSQPLSIAGAEAEFPASAEILLQAASHPSVHVDIERPFWWDLPVWVASRRVHSIGLCNGHMQREGMLNNEAWGKPRDRLTFPDSHGTGLWSQHVYYQLLETGVRIPPSAGSASGLLTNPVGYNRVYVHCGEQLDYEAWWENLRAGRVVVTNGPLISDPRVNGELPGHVFHAAAGQTVALHPALNLATRDPVDYLEVIKNGQVEHEVRLDEWAREGGELPEVVFEESGWMLIRAVTAHPRTYRFASTGPYYVQIGSERRISRQAAQFFLDWVHERAGRVDLADPDQRAAVLRYHRAARDFWQRVLAAANAD